MNPFADKYRAGGSEQHKATQWVSILGVLWFVALGGVLVMKSCGDFAFAHEYSEDVKTQRWFEGLMQPDNPWQSCCGEADSYLADELDRGPNGEWIAIITDGRDDQVPCPSCDGGYRKRQHREPGTRIVVPEAKIKFDQGNPTGHGIIFMPQISSTIGADYSVNDMGGNPIIPYCYLPPALF